MDDTYLYTVTSLQIERQCMLAHLENGSTITAISFFMVFLCVFLLIDKDFCEVVISHLSGAVLFKCY